MTGLALALLLAAAFIHASWNLLAKRASGDVTFTWLFAVWSVALYAPLAAAVIFWRQAQIGLTEIGFMAGSALLHTGYFVLLNQGYRFGDLSLVYPLARGTGPLLSCAAAICSEMRPNRNTTTASWIRRADPIGILPWKWTFQPP